MKLNIKETILTTEQIETYIKENIELYPDTKEYAKLFHLDYLNNYLSLDKMSQDYYISHNEATNWLNIGRYLNNY